jgi:hypothetical protein
MGNFDAIIKSVDYVGAEMGPWDNGIVSLLPDSLKIYAPVWVLDTTGWTLRCSPKSSDSCESIHSLSVY